MSNLGLNYPAGRGHGHITSPIWPAGRIAYNGRLATTAIDVRKRNIETGAAALGGGTNDACFAMLRHLVAVQERPKHARRGDASDTVQDTDIYVRLVCLLRCYYSVRQVQCALVDVIFPAIFGESLLGVTQTAEKANFQEFFLKSHCLSVSRERADGFVLVCSVGVRPFEVAVLACVSALCTSAVPLLNECFRQKEAASFTPIFDGCCTCCFAYCTAGVGLVSLSMPYSALC